ncbi:MAG: 5-deoxy-glucuronate isomerase [Synergistaceae bacterium]|nr:5-deoxy-glucuronate isomerase [Synergistaceae bacterium]
MYIRKEPAWGYVPYLTRGEEDHGLGMSVGLLTLEPGSSWAFDEPEDELALDLLTGRATFAWDGERREVDRPDTFGHAAWCLHVCRGTRVVVEAVERTEIYVQRTDNDRTFPARLYGPDDIMIQHAGAGGELKGCTRRDIQTFFDYESAPWSNMVLGEVLSWPGKWSSYPPHHHPQPEVYFYRFDRPQGFGAGFANGEVYRIEHDGCLVIRHSSHSQVAAPGYALCYMWGIRHLPGDPWRKTRIDEPEHAWLLAPDANDHIFDPDR